MDNYIENNFNAEDAKPIMDIVADVTENSGMSATTKALIYLGTAVVATIGGVFGYKAYRKHQQSQVLNQPDADKPVEVTSEMINEVTE